MLRFIPLFLIALLTPALAMGATPDEAAFRAAQAHNGRAINAHASHDGGTVLHVAASTTSTATAPTSSSPPAVPPGKLSQTQVQQNPLLLLQQFTTSDLQAALADANAQSPPDTVSAACYTALLSVTQSPLSNPLPSQLGLFLALQKARDAQAFLANINSPNGPLSGLNTACAPLVLSVQNTLIQLGLLTGIVVGTGGTGALALPAISIPAIALPKL
jgi:hypothetical protein